MSTDDLFGNITEWESRACSLPSPSNCSYVIPISLLLPPRSPSPHDIIHELDSEILAFSFNIIVMVITLAFSSYFLLCFGNVLYVSDDEEDAVAAEPTRAEDSPVEPLDLQFIEQAGLLSADFSGHA